jgi:signal transduction histidine kinase
MRSLRTRLLVLLLGLAALAAGGVGLLTYRTVLQETDVLFDYQLQQMALSLRDQVAGPAEAEVAQRFDFVVQVWSADGAIVYSSHLPPRLPPRVLLGYSDVEAEGGGLWRVFSVATRTRVIQVAQAHALRRALAAQAALRSVTPLLIAAPLVALAAAWLVGVSLAPLRRLAALLRTRAADSLAPLPAGGLPSEVEPMVSSLNALLARLQSSFDAQRAFVADAAHELRSPLTALKLQVDVLARSGDEAVRRQALQDLSAGMQRAQRLVEQLLSLARSEPGGAELPLAPTDLAEAARQALADTVPLAAPRGVQLELEAPQPLPVRGDAQALRVLVRNLVDNAVRYAGAGARVLVTAAADGADAVLHVDDSGPGIPAAERERVFARFYRREGQAETGSGLGLAIVRAVADRHGARVQLAESALGGLRVELKMPRLDAG